MEKVEYYFREISKIPRGSYNEKAICDYVENFAKERNIKYVREIYTKKGMNFFCFNIINMRRNINDKSKRITISFGCIRTIL